jgi:hypothetical protein
LCNLVPQPFLEKQAVGQSRQGVMVSLIVQLIGELPLLDGDGGGSAGGLQESRLLLVGPSRFPPVDREGAKSFPVSIQDGRRPARREVMRQSQFPVFIPSGSVAISPATTVSPISGRAARA